MSREIDEGLERAERTRPIPRSVRARMRFLLKGAKGSTRKLAQDLGVSQRTVQRWLKGQGTPKAGSLGESAVSEDNRGAVGAVRCAGACDDC
ncbi:helix-turn-helix domain-containing protein [Kitasatospora sp. NPDC101235]|uniref:helix-turn-helix domain-containing protein n=1 Tax=Kitasatospora sp. NPDC101235 TaxID=3364101 RepID=UPI0038228AAB